MKRYRATISSIGKNFVKSKLENKEVCLGIWSIINANINLDIFSKCGIDFILLDMEHGNYQNNLEDCIGIIENNNTIGALLCSETFKVKRLLVRVQFVKMTYILINVYGDIIFTHTIKR